MQGKEDMPGSLTVGFTNKNHIEKLSQVSTQTPREGTMNGPALAVFSVSNCILKGHQDTPPPFSHITENMGSSGDALDGIIIV